MVETYRSVVATVAACAWCAPTARRTGSFPPCVVAGAGAAAVPPVVPVGIREIPAFWVWLRADVDEVTMKTNWSLFVGLVGCDSLFSSDSERCKEMRCNPECCEMRVSVCLCVCSAQRRVIDCAANDRSWSFYTRALWAVPCSLSIDWSRTAVRPTVRQRNALCASAPHESRAVPRGTHTLTHMCARGLREGTAIWNSM